jgi:hypothetical protein
MLIPDYAIELWDINGQLVADISTIASSRSYKLKLNDVEAISFTLDLNAFEALADQIGTHPRVMLSAGRTEVRIKRNGQYIVGGQVVKVIPSLADNGQTLQVDCDGYLNYFLQRYITKTYTATDRSQIAWDAINTTQSLDNGDFGVTQGDLATIFDSDRICDNDEIKDLITDYTWQQPTTYDFEFTPDKVFNTYTKKGSYKPEIRLIYGQNITSITSTIDASTIANKIIGIGSGIGESRLEDTEIDDTSAATYRLREKVMTYNSVSEQDTLNQNTAGSLALYKDVLEIPSVTISGANLDLSKIETGDYVYVQVDGYKYLDNMKGMFRINEIDVSLDENNAEEITLTFYDPRSGGALHAG